MLLSNSQSTSCRNLLAAADPSSGLWNVPYHFLDMELWHMLHDLVHLTAEVTIDSHSLDLWQRPLPTGHGVCPTLLCACVCVCVCVYVCVCVWLSLSLSSSSGGWRKAAPPPEPKLKPPRATRPNLLLRYSESVQMLKPRPPRVYELGAYHLSHTVLLSKLARGPLLWGVCPVLVLVPGTVTIKQRLPPSRHFWALSSSRLGGVFLNVHEVAFGNEKSWGLLCEAEGLVRLVVIALFLLSGGLFEGCLSTSPRLLFRHHSSLLHLMFFPFFWNSTSPVSTERGVTRCTGGTASPGTKQNQWPKTCASFSVLRLLLIGGTSLSLDRRTCNPPGRH